MLVSGIVKIFSCTAVGQSCLARVVFSQDSMTRMRKAAETNSFKLSLTGDNYSHEQNLSGIEACSALPHETCSDRSARRDRPAALLRAQARTTGDSFVPRRCRADRARHDAARGRRVSLRALVTPSPQARPGSDLAERSRLRLFRISLRCWRRSSPFRARAFAADAVT